jgi:hypothetical protein
VVNSLTINSAGVYLLTAYCDVYRPDFSITNFVWPSSINLALVQSSQSISQLMNCVLLTSSIDSTFKFNMYKSVLDITGNNYITCSNFNTSQTNYSYQSNNQTINLSLNSYYNNNGYYPNSSNRYSLSQVVVLQQSDLINNTNNTLSLIASSPSLADIYINRTIGPNQNVNSLLFLAGEITAVRIA